MKLLTQHELDELPPPAELAGATVFMTCEDDRPVWTVFQKMVDVNPDTVVFEDEER